MAWRHRDMENAHGGVLDRSVTTTEIVGRLVTEFSGEVELLGYRRKGVLLSELTDRRGWLQCASGC